MENEIEMCNKIMLTVKSYINKLISLGQKVYNNISVIAGNSKNWRIKIEFGFIHYLHIFQLVHKSAPTIFYKST